MFKAKFLLLFLFFNSTYLVSDIINPTDIDKNINEIPANKADLELTKLEYLKTKKSFLEWLKFWNTPEVNVKYKFNKFSAIIPEELYFIIEGFKNNSILLNRLILYGAPGNGKSSIANEIAKELNAEVIQISGPAIVTKFQGSGAETIKKSFEKALEYQKYNKRVVVFIDEIDSIAPNFDNDDRFHDHKTALQALWLWLDRVKNMPGVFVIAATNKFEKLDKAFISRFDGNIIELKNPNEYARKEIIEYYIKQFNKQILKPVILEDYLINYLVDNTDGLNTRTIEGIVRLIIQRASNNVDIRTSLISNIISKQKRLLLAHKEDDKEKKDIIGRIKSNLTVINVSLSVFCSCLFLYDRFIKNQRENAFWNPIIGVAKSVGMEDLARIAKNNPEEIAKASNALNNKTVIGYVFLSKFKDKAGNIKNLIVDNFPLDLGSIL